MGRSHEGRDPCAQMSPSLGCLQRNFPPPSRRLIGPVLPESCPSPYGGWNVGRRFRTLRPVDESLLRPENTPDDDEETLLRLYMDHT